jgi:hypothetical protein
MTRLLPVLFLAACGVPIDGPLPQGTWGGPHFELRVGADGSAALEADCAHGDLGVISADQGEVEVSFDWVSEGGPVPEPPEEPDATPVTLTATATARRLDGVLAADDGSFETDVEVRLGRPSTLLKCL